MSALPWVSSQLVVHGVVPHETVSSGDDDPLQDAVASRQGPCGDASLLTPEDNRQARSPVGSAAAQRRAARAGGAAAVNGARARLAGAGVVDTWHDRLRGTGPG